MKYQTTKVNSQEINTITHISSYLPSGQVNEDVLHNDVDSFGKTIQNLSYN